MSTTPWTGFDWESVIAELVARDKAHAYQLIAELVAKCARGEIDREGEAIGLAHSWNLEPDYVQQVQRLFARARNLEAEARAQAVADAVAAAPKPSGLAAELGSKRRRSLSEPLDQAIARLPDGGPPNAKPEPEPLRPPKIEVASSVSGGGEGLGKLITALPADLREEVSKALGLKRASADGTVQFAAKAGGALAPEVKKRALVKFNPVKNPFSQNGFENARLALEMMELDCGLDLFHSKPVIRGKHAWLGGDGFEDLDNVVLKLRQLILDDFGFDPKGTGTFDALRARCVDHSFNPLLDYLDGLQWDGKPRLDRWLIDYAAADDTPLNRAFGRKVLIAAVRRARRPGCKFDYLLVLEGKQGIGKSTLILILAGADYYSDKPIIGCDAREQQEAVQGVWLYEIAELEGLSKVDLSWMKGFLSRTHDKARPAFGRSVVNRPRQLIMIGSTNDPTYLRDTTGNRRWWPVKLHGRIDLAGVERDRDQLWAEAVVAEATGEVLVIPEALWGDAAIEQQARMEIDAWLEPISDCLCNLEAKRANLPGCFSSKDADKQCVPEFRVSSAYLLGEVLGISESHRGQRETKRLADVMRTLGWQLAQYPIKVGKKTCRAYVKSQVSGEGGNVT